TRYTAANPPGTPSADTAPLVTTPCRSSSTSAAAWVRTVESISTSGTSDHRPTTVLTRPEPAGQHGQPRRSAQPGAWCGRPGAVGGASAGEPGPQRSECVRGDHAGEHQVP